ncbi:MAG TPA: cation-translocating P-type ATPase [Cyclobacteriaceae bacterium]|nr:cation-translocating P-type ATPase [Cyclobacteriaceae bacterium]
MKTQADIIVEQSGIIGLTTTEVNSSRVANGSNEISSNENNMFAIIMDLVKEPMLLLLMVASIIYFITGNTGDGFFMVAAIIIVTGISLFQESRSKKALEKLRSLTQPLTRVIRDRKIQTIPKEEVVVGDYIIIEEGTSAPADGTIVQSNDFSVNESILTGESLPVQKDSGIQNQVFQGTLVVSGLAICQVTAVGMNTALGKIGKTLENIKKEDTPLQKQIGNFVKKMALAGSVIFLIVWSINFFESKDLLASLLKALTLAMSILPEEIPVAFTTFMALGAWRLMKLGVVIKNTSTVETLGSASIICLDKTGTITENRMQLTKVFSLSTNSISDAPHAAGSEVITVAMWASEPIPFDPMEIALHEAYGKISSEDERGKFKMIHEYPLDGKPPMMTHVFENATGSRIVAAKGAPEAMINVSDLTPEEKVKISNALKSLSSEGYRVLGVGVSNYTGDTFPKRQQDLSFTFLGLVAFYDPPKANIREVLNSFYKAGIQIKIITGDNAATTSTIARQINFAGHERAISGDELMGFSDEILRKKVMEYNIFTRMFPEAKLRIVNALKNNGHIVAMTGDGVNDGPALKTAHISIAMGKKGSEIAKEVSSIVLTDDDLGRMVYAIAMGRKIYGNLKKAIQYIISIHIPIILTVFVPLVLGWAYPAIFTPVHVIFLELIMGPTCSIIYENEPMEKNTMIQKPRPFTTTFFSLGELSVSIVQGLAITLGVLFIYQYAYKNFDSELITRTMVFTTLITANIFLTLVNRSFYYSIATTLRYKNNLVASIIAITIVLTTAFIFVTPLSAFFQLAALNFSQLMIAAFTGFISVIWFELVKLYKRLTRLTY